MKNIIQFVISLGDDGWYSASGVGLPVVTQGKTLDELASNIQEAVALHFSGENPRDFGFSERPSLLMNIELPAYA